MMVNQPTHRPWILAHRGLSEEAPENTLASFSGAVALGLDIELDLGLTRDGHVVIMHDRSVDRTTDGAGLVAQRTLAELKSLDAGSWFSPRFANERIPTLPEVLNLVRGRATLALNFKDTLRGAEDRLVESLKGYERVDRVFIFDQPPDSSRKIKELRPEIPVAVRADGKAAGEDFFEHAVKLFPEIDVVWAVDTRARGHQVDAEGYYITPRMVQASHEHAKRIVAVVVDDPGRWPALLAMGIDGICTRRPRQLKALMEGA